MNNPARKMQEPRWSLPGLFAFLDWLLVDALEVRAGYVTDDRYRVLEPQIVVNALLVRRAGVRELAFRVRPFDFPDLQTMVLSVTRTVLVLYVLRLFAAVVLRKGTDKPDRTGFVVRIRDGAELPWRLAPADALGLPYKALLLLLGGRLLSFMFVHVEQATNEMEPARVAEVEFLDWSVVDLHLVRMRGWHVVQASALARIAEGGECQLLSHQAICLRICVRS